MNRFVCSNKACGLIYTEKEVIYKPEKQKRAPSHKTKGAVSRGHCPRCDCTSFYYAAPGEKEKPKTGAQLIALERTRQQVQEKFSHEHDGKHQGEELVAAAVCYLESNSPNFAHARWPWEKKWWKPSPDNRIRELVKAGALIAAEIDRLKRDAGED